MRDGAAVLTLPKRSAATTVVQILIGIGALIIRRLVRRSGTGNRASSQLLGAALNDTIVTLALPTVVAPIVAAVIATVAAVITAIATVVTAIVTSTVATTRWGLRRRGMTGGGRSRVLLAAPRSLGPGEATLAGGLRRILMPRSAAALFGVPVPVILGAVTRARRGGRSLRSSMIEAAAELGIPKLIALAAVTSFNSGLCGREANKSCGEDNDASEGFHCAADRADAKV